MVPQALKLNSSNSFATDNPLNKAFSSLLGIRIINNIDNGQTTASRRDDNALIILAIT